MIYQIELNKIDFKHNWKSQKILQNFLIEYKKLV